MRRASNPEVIRFKGAWNLSIALGIYDAFSYVIPGMLYLYLVNEILKLSGWQSLDLAQLTQGGTAAPNALATVLLAVGAYLLGHLFDGARAALVDKWLFYYGAPEKVLTRIKQRLGPTQLKVDFHGDEWAVCLQVLQVRTKETIQEAERLKATGLMMRNFSFGAFLFALLQLVQFFVQKNSPHYLALCAAGLVAMVIAHHRAKRFDEWSYGNIFLQALAYGSNLKEFLENESPAWHPGDKAKKLARKLDAKV